ncbi:MAG TPA: S41 family peptidase [Kofleriaceae bacterium]|nr:S41 family peptidase [Kofleriaceae bacterium]
MPRLDRKLYDAQLREPRPAFGAELAPGPRLHARVFVLLDGRATSAAETFLQLARDNRIGTFIGETSGGTNGNVVDADLPGGFTLSFTGMRVLLPDRSLLQGRGIAPDVTIHPSVEAARAGRDEILEAAVARAKDATP